MNLKNKLHYNPRLLLPIIVFFFALIIASSLYTEEKPDQRRCGFVGVFNKEKTTNKNIKCSIERAGSREYLLIRIYNRENWILDVSGIKNSGQPQVSLSIIGPGGYGAPNAKTYTKQLNVNILRDKKDPSLRGFRVNTKAISKEGKIPIKGIIVWEVETKTTEKIKGDLSMRIAGKSLVSRNIQVVPWNNAYRISGTIRIKDGETLTYGLNFPSLKNGAYDITDPLDLNISHAIISSDGSMDINIYSAKKITVTVTNKKKLIKVHFKGKVKYANNKEAHISGTYYGKIIEK